MNTSRPPRRPRAGFTLFELMLVVAILAVVVGFAIPEIRRLMRRSEVNDAARQLRVALLQARLKSIESGGRRWFRYQREGSAFEVAADGESPAGGESALGSVGADESSPSRAVAERSSAVVQILPAGVRFLDATAADRQVAQPTEASSATWSPPIAFYPNGRATNARLRLGNDRYWVDVTLRGLTGRVQIGPVQHAEQPEDSPLPDFSSEDGP
jgi:prepilin-type N-terminal cleavage/methylation domain-containing protein